MKLSFTRLMAICLAMLTFQISFAQAPVAGDYRSVRPNTGAGPNYNWTNIANWETYNGTSWIAASAYPTSADGVITISTGDSITITTTPVTIDQVHVASGGSLIVFSTTATLNNGTGDDIIVDGDGNFNHGLYVATSGIVTGAGATIQVNSGGMMQIRNSGNVQVNTTSSGELQFAATGSTITGATITSNGTSTWSGGNIGLNNGTIINNGTMTISSNAFITSVGAGTTNSFTNSATGIMRKTLGTGTSGTSNGVNGVSFTNSGTLTGVGTYQFQTAGTATVTSNGTITPGNNAVGTLALNTNILINGQTPTLTFQVVDLSGAGTGNDLLTITGSTNLTGSVIQVIDNLNAAPVGTYTVMTTTGTFSGTADFSQLPTNFVGIQNATNVQVQKTAQYPLPLVWGSFTAAAKTNNQVQLNWTTLEETNTSYFVIEQSVDGRNYTSLGTVQARNGSGKTDYSFVHTSPDRTRVNHYRIKQVDIDGKFSYSYIRSVRFEKGNVAVLLATPNPVRDVLQITVQERVNVVISDLNGRIVRKLTLSEGYHPVNLQSLQKGIYQLAVFRNNELVDVQKLVKQ